MVRWDDGMGHRENLCEVDGLNVKDEDAECVIHVGPLLFVQPLGARKMGQVV